ncbi:hypothetical protein PCK1_000189 [Pneumocystis canis]|nr:hypothetical protein PCK1_000189 [Pneumocystis canis]
MHTKKRPHTLIFARMFDYDVLDMIELSIQNPVSMFEFKNEKNGIGLRPMLLFIGPLFESSPKYRLCKSIFFDFFRGQPFNKLNVEGLQHAICFSVQEPTDDVPYPPIYFRVYMVKYQKINQINPKIDLEEMGPRYDFVIQRTYEADDKLMKEAMKKPKKQTPVIKKNIDVNKIGDKVGQIYLMKQNMDNLQTRKFRGLKRKTTEKNEDISYNKNSKKHCPTTSERNESTS